jgi:hypothetical protein
MRPPSAIERLESPPGKGVVEERFKRGTTEDILAADVQNEGASGTEFKKLARAEDTHARGESDANPRAMASNDGQLKPRCVCNGKNSTRCQAAGSNRSARKSSCRSSLPQPSSPPPAHRPLAMSPAPLPSLSFFLTLVSSSVF